VYEAAQQAAIHNTIMNFPDKYSTVVGERGLKVIEIPSFLRYMFLCIVRLGNTLFRECRVMDCKSQITERNTHNVDVLRKSDVINF